MTICRNGSISSAYFVVAFRHTISSIVTVWWTSLWSTSLSSNVKATRCRHCATKNQHGFCSTCIALTTRILLCDLILHFNCFGDFSLVFLLSVSARPTEQNEVRAEIFVPSPTSHNNFTVNS